MQPGILCLFLENPEFIGELPYQLSVLGMIGKIVDFIGVGFQIVELKPRSVDVVLYAAGSEILELTAKRTLPRG